MELLTSEQLSEWEAYDRIEPVCSDWRQDYRLAYMSSLIVNIVNKMFGRPGAKLHSPEDLMLTWGEAALEAEFRDIPLQSLEEMKKAVMSIAAAFKAKDKTQTQTQTQKPPGNVPVVANKKPVTPKSTKR